jgi:hypothetical protein
MSSKIQIVMLGLAIIFLAICLATFVEIRNDYFGQNALPRNDRQSSTFVGDLPTVLHDVIPKKAATTTTPTAPAELTAETCSRAGGTWNECGSLCRGKPPGTVCAQICIPQCECTVGEKQCPDGYACASDLPAGDGVCRPGEGGGKIPVPPAKSVREFRSADGVTSVVLAADQTLTNPFEFYGTSTAFENTISWQVKQLDGKIVAQGNIMTRSPDAGVPGQFMVKGFYDAIPNSASGTLVVFEASAEDGSPIHMVEIPVNLSTNRTKVYVYWGNSKKNPQAQNCSLVYPVAHEVVAPGPDDQKAVAIAMHELLKGPTTWEKSQGYYTSLPLKIADPSFTLFGLEFQADLQEGVGGSCRTAAIRAQINETYKRNKGVKENPIISIDGRTEDILQP